MEITAAGVNTAGSIGSGLELHGITVVNTRTGELSPNRNVLIAHGKISRIVPTGKLKSGKNESVVDARGKFLVPGFLDMHTHVLQQEGAVEASSALMLAHGITGIRQMAGSTDMLRRRKAGTLSLGEHAPELLTLCGEIRTRLPRRQPARRTRGRRMEASPR